MNDHNQNDIEKPLVDSEAPQASPPPGRSPDGTLMDEPASLWRTSALSGEAQSAKSDRRAPSAVASTPPIGYEIIEEIGRGGMSVVYRAREAGLHREIALKRLLPNYAASEKAVARMLREARAIANVQHPNIVHVYAVGQDENGPYIAMELVAGPGGQPQTLDARIKSDGPLSETEAVDLVHTLCTAAQAAHDKGIIHRDIKPSNVLLTSQGDPKLADFGIAHAAADTLGGTLAGLTVEGSTLGTLDFMAPEQEGGAHAADARADVYALGGVLYFCLTGKTMRHFRESEVPPALRAVICLATEHAPDRRYATAAGFAEALKAAASPAASAPAARLLSNDGPPQCPHCHIEVAGADKFCPGCGGSLLRKCPECDGEISMFAGFCPECGANVIGFDQAAAVLEAMQQAVAAKHWQEALEACAGLPADLRLSAARGKGVQQKILDLRDQSEAVRRQMQECLIKAEAAVSANDLSAQARALAHYVELYPHDAKVRQRVADVRKALEVKRWETAMYTVKACEARRDYAGAISAYDEYLEAYPHGEHAAEARRNRAQAVGLRVAQIKEEIAGLRGEKRLHDALQLAKEGIALAPEDAEATRLEGELDALVVKADRLLAEVKQALTGWRYGKALAIARELESFIATEEIKGLIAEAKQRLRRRKQLIVAALAVVAVIGTLHGFATWQRTRRDILEHNRQTVSEAQRLAASGRYVEALARHERLQSSPWHLLRLPELSAEWVPQADLEGVRSEYERRWRTHQSLLETHGGERWRDVQRKAQIGAGSVNDPVAGRKAYEQALAELPAAVTEARQIAISAALGVARRAQSQGQWYDVFSSAQQVLLLDPNHREAQELNREAIENAPRPVAGQNWRSFNTGMEFVWIEEMKLWVGKHEVTNEEYRKKEPNHNSREHGGHSLNGDRQPVVYVNFEDAKAYAGWLTQQDRAVLGGARYRLPSEREWETFARCGDNREYPWGNQWPPRSGQAGNYADETAKRALSNFTVISGYNDGFPVTAEVDRLWANPWGLHGVGGNVWEACASDSSGGSFGAWRGASWRNDYRGGLRVSTRLDVDGSRRRDRSGFRLLLSR